MPINAQDDGYWWGNNKEKDRCNRVGRKLSTGCDKILWMFCSYRN